MAVRLSPAWGVNRNRRAEGPRTKGFCRMARRRRKPGHKGPEGPREAGGQGQPVQKNGAAGGSNGSAEDKENGLRQIKANMVILVDADPTYVEMESMGVVNYIPGYNPMGFTGLSRALSYIENPRNEGRVGLVLLDLDPATAEELTVEAFIRQLRRKGDVPVALASSRNDAETVAMARELGLVGVLPKVFTLEQFVHFTKRILRYGATRSWQCRACGRLITADHLDLLGMKPLKCTFRECASILIEEVAFGAPIQVSQ